ncbi:MAG TPA: ribosome-associated translation inhibitor RaiA [Bacilli bacterium]|jgi:putative sigma-54 modulation protein|nr:ribosome-associated translation inhibitor RaiA [Bacilli bacterium]HPZ23359.1 ribosome-associated translation inhibitor RaiA [Bacilli bacterium]HQC83674.1 ribosome-associated translation inhibitor RaiA [Bacilli bacterium]
MNINIRGDKIEITDSIKKYVEDKLARLDKYYDNASSINAKVLIKSKNDLDTIEVTIPTNKFTLRAEETNNDLYAAIDLVTDVLERQIRKNKTRLNSHKKAEPDFAFAYVAETIEDNEKPSTIVKRKTIESKPMSEEEAILQMELIDHDFFVFKNIDQGCFSVVYKRKDGNYGIIDSIE